jgi:hypothetical protein
MRQAEQRGQERMDMTIKTIIWLHAKPRKRSELVSAMHRVIVTMREVPGFRGIARYEVLEDPDKLLEIVERESPETRQTWLNPHERVGRSWAIDGHPGCALQSHQRQTTKLSPTAWCRYI